MGKAANRRKRQRKEQRRQLPPPQPVDTVEQAVDYLAAHLPADALTRWQTMPVEDAAYDAYRNFGLFVRNHFGLWQQNPALLRACGSETMFADDASMIILQALMQRLHSP